MKHISNVTIAKADHLSADQPATNVFDVIISLLGGDATTGANIFDVIASVLNKG